MTRSILGQFRNLWVLFGIRNMRAFLALSTCVMFVSGCSSDTAGPKDITGTYDLRSINGKLPFTIWESSVIRQDVVSGTMLLSEDRTFTERMNATSYSKSSGTISGQDQFRQQGEYIRSGNTVTLDSGQEPITVTVSGDRLTYVTPNNLTVVFER